MFVTDWSIGKKGWKVKSIKPLSTKNTLSQAATGFAVTCGQILGIFPSTLRVKNKLKTKKQRSRTCKETIHDASANSPILPISHDFCSCIFGGGDSRLLNHHHVGTGEFPSSGAFGCSGDIKEPRNRVIQLGPQTYIHGLGNASLHPLAAHVFLFSFLRRVKPVAERWVYGASNGMDIFEGFRDQRWEILTVDFVDFYWMAILLGKKSPLTTWHGWRWCSFYNGGMMC